MGEWGGKKGGKWGCVWVLIRSHGLRGLVGWGGCFTLIFKDAFFRGKATPGGGAVTVVFWLEIHVDDTRVRHKKDKRQDRCLATLTVSTSQGIGNYINCFC